MSLPTALEPQLRHRREAIARSRAAQREADANRVRQAMWRRARAAELAAASRGAAVIAWADPAHLMDLSGEACDAA